MAVKDEAAKRRTTKKNEGNKQREDRLSSLSDDILIGILSCLPFRLAVITGSLSRRWRGLWKNVTSVRINNPTFKRLSAFMAQFSSPSIHSFVVEFKHESSDMIGFPSWPISMDSLLRIICDRNVRELKLTTHGDVGWYISVPRFVFQTQSLVSLELCSTRDLELPDTGGPINLPNLKKLSLLHSSSCYEWLEKLIKACPSLEDLSLKSRRFLEQETSGLCFTCSNQNLRRIIINSCYLKCSKIVIDAPKLEYLDVSAGKSVTYCFEEEPVGLREAKIVINDYYPRLSEDENTVISKFYSAICDARFLTLDCVVVLENMSIVFRHATQLTLDMKYIYNINIVLSLLDMCPALDVLILNFMNIGYTHLIHHKRANVSNLRRVLKRIEIKTDWHSYFEPTETFLELVKYLLSGAIDLKHFHFTVGGCEDIQTKSVEYKQSRELELCKLLYKCPMVSMGCEVEFTGRYLNMSGKPGPKAWKGNGEVIHYFTS